MSETVLAVEREDRDLGFGGVVAGRSGVRLLNRDGTFNVHRRGLGLRSSLSLYYSLLTMSWPSFIALALLAYGVANAVFACAYLLCGANAIQPVSGFAFEGRFANAFFFSVHTLSTVGYGSIVPANVAANFVMTIEAVVGLFGLALGTGLIFARFIRPQAAVRFSENAVVAPYRDVEAFQFRLANERRNQLFDVEARVILAWFVERDGRRQREFVDLALERSRVSFFPLSWTIVHPIDENSPLVGQGPEELERAEAEFLVLLSGIDETFSQVVHARTSYITPRARGRQRGQVQPHLRPRGGE